MSKIAASSFFDDLLSTGRALNEDDVMRYIFTVFLRMVCRTVASLRFLMRSANNSPITSYYRAFGLNVCYLQ